MSRVFIAFDLLARTMCPWRQSTICCTAESRTASQRFKMFFGALWKSLEFESYGRKAKNAFWFQFDRIVIGSGDPSPSCGRPIINGYFTYDSKVDRRKLQDLDRVVLVDLSHDHSSPLSEKNSSSSFT